jgi:iron complex outermembrane receptor protein
MSKNWMQICLDYTGHGEGPESAPRNKLKLGWTGISGAQAALHGLQSEYIFNYPVNNASFAWLGHLKGAYMLRTRVEVIERYHQVPYPVWDAEVARERGWLHPYLGMTNISNTGYQEIAGVPMPGRGLVGGVELILSKR